MDRDEIILSMKPIVDNIVKKYTNKRKDEDLSSIGMIAVINCVDRCIKEQIEDYEIIKARCIVWSKNKILDTLRKKDYKFVYDNTLLDNVSQANIHFSLIDIKSSLTPRQKEVFDLLLSGSSYTEIMTSLKISYPMYHKHITNIKKKIIEKE